MHEVFDLDGTNFIRGRCQSANGSGIELQLTICAPSGFAGDAGYYPAESITISDLIAIEALAELCTKLVAEHAAIKARQHALRHNGPDSPEPNDEDD